MPKLPIALPIYWQTRRPMGTARRLRLRPSVALALAVWLVAGCATSARVVDSWRGEAATPPYRRLVVLAGGPDERRYEAERTMASALRRAGADAQARIEVLGRGAEERMERILVALEARDVDGVLALNLGAVKVTECAGRDVKIIDLHEDEPSETFRAANVSVSVYATLWDVAARQRVWEAHVVSENPGCAEWLIDDTAAAVTDALTRQGLVASG